MEKAIIKAIQGGYRQIGQNYEIVDSNSLRLYRTKDNSTTALLSKDNLLTDPNFWRCVVDALATDNNGMVVSKSGATYLQHDFIDCVANGGDINSFFNNF
jgi:hypothetical protein